MTRYELLCVVAVLLANGAAAGKASGLGIKNTCGGTITNPTTISVSHTQGNSLNCVWNIQATSYVKVMVQPNHVNLDADCNNNYIKIYDGPAVDTEKLLATICGNSDSRLIIPASVNTMTVQFSSHKQGNDFSAKVHFADSEIVGCGGDIHLMTNLGFTLRPVPMVIYGREMVNCIWNIWSPENMTISVRFLTVDFPVCTNAPYNSDTYHQHHDTHQNRMWPTTCDSTCGCNFLEVFDGIVPDSYKIGSYCGRCSPPEVITSSNSLGLWVSTMPSSGFSLRIDAVKATCTPTVVAVSTNPTHLTSPGYPSLGRGIHCVYEFQADSHPVHLTIKNLDIQPGTTAGVCDKDKIVIEKRSTQKSLGKNYVISSEVLDETQNKRYEFCGTHEKIELKIQGSFFLNLLTTKDNVSYKGLETEVVLA